MNRRFFISGTTLAATGFLLPGRLALPSSVVSSGDVVANGGSLYEIFMDPGLRYRPFVRWWWNGNKVEAAELVRELRLLREAGIGGVEINPVQFPSRSEGDDLGKPSLHWLSREWIDMLSVVFGEAKSLGMTCDLIVGSGWPYGAEYLEEGEQSQTVVITARKVSGSHRLTVSRDELMMEAEPAVSSPWEGRKSELLSLYLVPDPVTSPEQIIDLSDKAGSEYIDILIPGGDHFLYALVKYTGFMAVINGSPGASGPVLDHFNAPAVRRYLTRMSDTIEAQTGPLSQHIRSLFTDSMELEGANWSDDMRSEFISRRGYDIFPFLPFALFRTGAMGNVTDFNYGAGRGAEFTEMVCRMRYDFETVKAELLLERFLKTFSGWCSELGVRSRMQAYGRGFHPLESSFAVDIPEGESWTMNWLKHRIGEEMPESDYRRGRAYTMINKYVSSAAHLAGKRLISCEEMTDTYSVFNTSLENLKTGSDQSIITGVTHSVFHGFNYSPPEAPYPGWIRYGCYYNENNNWWPHFHLLNEYKGRLSAVLQNTEMFADIAILPPLGDMWSLIGVQTEPFPAVTHVEYFTLIWEAICKNGSSCDYVSEKVICESLVEEGYLIYGSRRYRTLFLVQVESVQPETARKMAEFIEGGGRIFCIETFPSKSPGWKDHEAHDSEVRMSIERMITYPDRFIMLKKPENDFIDWYRTVQEQHLIDSYLRFESPGPFLMQTRYQSEDGTEFIFVINSHLHAGHRTMVTFSPEITTGRHGWIWDPETGNRYRIGLSKEGTINLDIGPAESLLFVFDRERRGPEWEPLPVSGPGIIEVSDGWSAVFRHCHDDSKAEVLIDRLNDLKEMPEFVHFSGTVIYRNTFTVEKKMRAIINLGKVYGTSDLRINGISCGVKWYGRRIFAPEEYLKKGINTIEITVTTSMGNYMKSLTDNPIAQYWTNEKNKIQPLQSMGLLGPVSIYER
ncbi:MAG: glycoside hydrolase family 2 [Bacteroidales bacterium]|nr:glycoside hydrolase family 2 [Bacteroidales bacterium]